MGMRKTYSADFKAQAVLEMLKEEKTVAELASQYGVHATMLHRWKKAALEALPEVFREGAKEAARARRSTRTRSIGSIGRSAVSPLNSSG
jgi:transposase-like protein